MDIRNDEEELSLVVLLEEVGVEAEEHIAEDHEEAAPFFGGKLEGKLKVSVIEKLCLENVSATR